MQLSEHILQSIHAAHLVEDTRVDHAGHLLIQLGHLRRVDVLREVAALEEALDAAHLLHDGGKLGVLRKELLDLTLGDACASGHPDDPRRLLAEELGALARVELTVGHRVHDGHHALEATHRLGLRGALRQLSSKARNHVENLVERAHLHDVRQLFVHVSQRKLAVLQLLDELLIVLQLELVHLVYEALNVTHAEKLADEGLHLWRGRENQRIN